MDWMKVVLNAIAAAATGYLATGDWTGAVAAVLSSLAALFQVPPHQTKNE